MDMELLDDLRAFSKNLDTIIELSEGESQSLTDEIADKFGINKNKRWWWEDLLGEFVSINYEDEDGLDIIRNFLDDSTLIYVFVTDDEFKPWPAFKGSLGHVIELISEQRFFEYFITNVHKDWCVFDTHHNSLVIIGDLKNRTTHPGLKKA